MRDRLPRNYWQAAGRALALSMRLIPRAHRFDVAMRVARTLEPMIARTGAYRARTETRTDGLREVALDLVLEMLTNYDTAFDPTARVERPDLLEDALSSGGGVLIVGPHTILCHIAARNIHDRGRDLTAMTAYPVRILGTSIEMRTILPSSTKLVRGRDTLRAGHVLFAFVDRADASDPSVRRVETPDGPVYVADALFRLATRTDAAVLFFASYIDSDGEVVILYGAPRSRESVDAVMEDFKPFLCDYLEQRRSARSAALRRFRTGGVFTLPFLLL